VWLSKVWLQLPLFLAFLGIIVGSAPLVGLAMFLLAAGALASYWSRHALDRVSYTRHIPESRGFPGDVLQITLRLVNDKPLPLPWLRVREAAPEGVQVDHKKIGPSAYPGYVQVNQMSHVSWYERVSWRMPYKATNRGHFKLGPARVYSGDIFGFFPTERDETKIDELIVYPKVYDLPTLGLPPERPFGDMKGRQRIFEDPSRITGLRDYRPGDPMRRIDWKASARSQALQSRVYEPSGTLHMMVALNVDTMEHVWEGYVPELLERLVSLAGSAASYGFESGYAIGLATNGSFPESDRPLRVPVGRTADQLAKVLEALAVIGPFTLSPLEAVIDREAQRFPFGATLVCVTSRMDAPLARSLLKVATAGHAVSVMSLSDKDFSSELPGIRVYDLRDVLPDPTIRKPLFQ
jgi:uncharacterized protein (DUF58 family)